MTRWKVLVPAVALAAVLSGCSQQQTAVESVPALSASLTRVDAAVAAGNYRQARQRLRDLVRLVVLGERAGRLSHEQASQIEQYAFQLLARLPSPAPPSPAPRSSPSPQPQPAAPPTYTTPVPEPVESKPAPSPEERRPKSREGWKGPGTDGHKPGGGPGHGEGHAYGRGDRSKG